jgi:hypothetical protein
MPAWQVIHYLQLRITTNGDVWGEFLSSKQPDRITLAMTITGDGQTVVVFRPTNDDCTARDDRPPAVNASTLEKFTPATLPLAYDAKYTFLATHIDRLRSETAKVTLYSSTLGKCVLYENGFVRVFCPDGWQRIDECTLTYCPGVECECSGDTVQAFRRTSATDRIATTVSEQRNEDVKRARTMVLSIEHALEAVDGTHSHGFPAVCGRCVHGTHLILYFPVVQILLRRTNQRLPFSRHVLSRRRMEVTRMRRRHYQRTINLNNNDVHLSCPTINAPHRQLFKLKTERICVNIAR